MKTDLGKILKVLREGGLILYPTDTVWGIGCDATSEEAVRKVFTLKKRADSKSLVLLADSVEMISKYVDEVPEMAAQLVEVNDAPMTVIYPGALVNVPGDKSTAGLLAPSCVAEDGSVGIRVPVASEYCMQLLTAFGRPIVSTSANISGEPTPKTFDHISDEILSGVDFTADRSCESNATGTPSQIIKVDLDGGIKIIRG